MKCDCQRLVPIGSTTCQSPAHPYSRPMVKADLCVGGRALCSGCLSPTLSLLRPFCLITLAHPHVLVRLVLSQFSGEPSLLSGPGSLDNGLSVACRCSGERCRRNPGVDPVFAGMFGVLVPRGFVSARYTRRTKRQHLFSQGNRND